MDGGGASDQATSYLATVLSEVERLLEAGDRDGAVALLEENLDKARTAMAYEPQGVLHAALGDVHQRAGAVEAALAQYEKAAAALHEAGDSASEAGALLRCGDAQRALKRVGAATQSYSAAAALYVMLGDPRGAGHGEFLLAELAAGVNREIAEKHYTQAIDFYREAAERESAPAGGAVPPFSVSDPRQVDSASMLEVAQRGLERLQAGPVRHVDTEPGEWTPPVAPPPPAAAAPAEVAAPAARAPAEHTAPPAEKSSPAPLSLAVLGVGVCGLILLALQWSDEVPLLSLAGVVVAGGIALLVARRAHALSPYLGYGAAGVAWLLLLVSGARPILRQQQPAAPPKPAVGAAPPAAAREPWTPEGQRASYERELVENEGDARQQAEVLRRYAEFECSQGEHAHCLELWARSQERYRDAAAPGKAAEVAIAMGMLHMRGQRPEPARQHFDVAVALYTEAHDAGGTSLALRHRGEAEVALQRWNDAIASYNDGLHLAQQQRDLQGETMLLLRCAVIEKVQGRIERARALLYQALRLSDAIGPLHARVWLALADFEASLDLDAAALRAYERAATLAGAERDADLEARGLRHRASYEARRGQLAAARARYEVGIRLAHARGAPVAEGLTYIGAAELEAQAGDVLAARNFYASAEALFAERPRSPGAVRVALGLGDLDAGVGDVESARGQYARALALAVQADHTGLQIESLDRLTHLLADRDPEATTTYAEQAASLRAQAFGAG